MEKPFQGLETQAELGNHGSQQHSEVPCVLPAQLSPGPRSLPPVVTLHRDPGGLLALPGARAFLAQAPAPHCHRWGVDEPYAVGVVSAETSLGTVV